jgi:hypothetical protein
LFVLLTICEEVVEGEHSWRNQVVRFEQIEVVVVYAYFNIFAPLFLLLDEACC